MALNTLVEGLSPDRADGAVLALNALLGLGTALAPVLVALFTGLGAWWALAAARGDPRSRSAPGFGDGERFAATGPCICPRDRRPSVALLALCRGDAALWRGRNSERQLGDALSLHRAARLRARRVVRAHRLLAHGDSGPRALRAARPMVFQRNGSMSRCPSCSPWSSSSSAASIRAAAGIAAFAARGPGVLGLLAAQHQPRRRRIPRPGFCDVRRAHRFLPGRLWRHGLRGRPAAMSTGASPIPRPSRSEASSPSLWALSHG